jgi:hypothetical protein
VPAFELRVQVSLVERHPDVGRDAAFETPVTVELHDAVFIEGLAAWVFDSEAVGRVRAVSSAIRTGFDLAMAYCRRRSVGRSDSEIGKVAVADVYPEADHPSIVRAELADFECG